MLYLLASEADRCSVGRPPFQNHKSIPVQVTIYRRLRIGRDGHLDQSEANDMSQIVHAQHVLLMHERVSVGDNGRHIG